MNADEVRRRNWVLVPMGGPVIIPAYPKRIKGITKFGEFDFTEPTYPEDHIVPAKHCSGVPLTEEILLKAGFEKAHNDYHNTDQFRHPHFKLLLRSEEDGSYTPCSHGQYLYSKGERINSLHQLQNLFFALTGQELEINR